MRRYKKLNQWIRPRFSLRTLLILTALAAVGCYWWIAPPTHVAKRFAKAVNDKDYTTAKSMVAVSQRPSFFDLWFAVLAAYQQEVADDPTIEVAMMRRTMQDIYHRERRIDVRIFHNATSPGRREAGPARISHTVKVPSRSGPRAPRRCAAGPSPAKNSSGC